MNGKRSRASAWEATLGSQRSFGGIQSGYWLIDWNAHEDSWSFVKSVSLIQLIIIVRFLPRPLWYDANWQLNHIIPSKQRNLVPVQLFYIMKKWYPRRIGTIRVMEAKIAVVSDTGKMKVWQICIRKSTIDWLSLIVCRTLASTITL